MAAVQILWLLMIVEIVIVVLLLAPAYAWGVYPFLLASLAGRGKRKEVSGKGKTEEELPGVAVILAAYNEETHIRARIGNLLELDYPKDKIEIHVGDDASSDKTGEIAEQLAVEHSNVHIHHFHERRGKVAVLKDLVRAVCEEPRTTEEFEQKVTKRTKNNEPDKNDILVFTDANTMFREDALGKLLKHFDDPKVGGVCGRLIFHGAKEAREKGEEERGKREEQRTENNQPNNPTTQQLNNPLVVRSLGEGGTTKQPDNQLTDPTHSAEGIYWQWENRLKEQESALDSCLGANGAIYAIRSNLFWKEIPDNTIVDDFVIGMKVREQGYRMVYEPEAIAEEEFPATGDEWRRRVRIGAGDYQALQLCRKCLSPKYGRFAWMFFSHKILRWFTPHLLLIALTLSVYQQWTTVSRLRFHDYGSATTSFLLIIGGFAVLFLCALLGRLVRASHVSIARPFKLCDHFVTMQAALFVGFLRFCRGNLKGSWERTPRGK